MNIQELGKKLERELIKENIPYVKLGDYASKNWRK